MTAKPPRTWEPKGPEQPRWSRSPRRPPHPAPLRDSRGGWELPARPPQVPRGSQNGASPIPLLPFTRADLVSNLVSIALHPGPRHRHLPSPPRRRPGSAPANFRFRHLPHHRVSVLPPVQNGFRRCLCVAAAEEAEGLGRWRRRGEPGAAGGWRLLRGAAERSSRHGGGCFSPCWQRVRLTGRGAGQGRAGLASPGLCGHSATEVEGGRASPGPL